MNGTERLASGYRLCEERLAPLVEQLLRGGAIPAGNGRLIGTHAELHRRLEGLEAVAKRVGAGVNGMGEALGLWPEAENPLLRHEAGEVAAAVGQLLALREGLAGARVTDAGLTPGVVLATAAVDAVIRELADGLGRYVEAIRHPPAEGGRVQVTIQLNATRELAAVAEWYRSETVRLGTADLLAEHPRRLRHRPLPPAASGPKKKEGAGVGWLLAALGLGWWMGGDS